MRVQSINVLGFYHEWASLHYLQYLLLNHLAASRRLSVRFVTERFEISGFTKAFLEYESAVHGLHVELQRALYEVPKRNASALAQAKKAVNTLAAVTRPHLENQLQLLNHKGRDEKWASDIDVAQLDFAREKALTCCVVCAFSKANNTSASN